MEILQSFQDNIYFVAIGVLLAMIFKTPILTKFYKLKYLSVEDANKIYRDKIDKALFLDIRSKFETDRRPAIKKSKLIPLMKLSGKMEGLKKLGTDKKVIIVCQSGRRAPSAGVKLKRAGFSEVFVMKGGLSAWEKSGYFSKKGKK